MGHGPSTEERWYTTKTNPKSPGTDPIDSTTQRQGTSPPKHLNT